MIVTAQLLSLLLAAADRIIEKFAELEAPRAFPIGRIPGAQPVTP